MNALIETVKAQWNKMSLPIKIGGSVLVGGVFLSLVLFALLSSTDYQPLYTDLAAEDASAVVSALQESNVPYQLADDGSTILVPGDRMHELRLTLAGQGLPRGGIVGFEIFESTRLGETEADRQLRFLWALQGELTRTIRELREVEDARVHIVMPEQSLFIQERRPSTASVLLQLRPGRQLGRQQVSGIAHMVATSVEGLDPDNVTIVDGSGSVLNQQSNDFAMDGESIATRLELERAYEQQLEQSLTTMLERVYGRGHVVARVRADLNFDVVEEYQERFEPVVGDDGIVRSEQTVTELFSGTDIGPGGAPGVDANVPGYVEAIEGAESEYERQEAIMNYEINRIERHQTFAPGDVRQLSVSVWVDGALEPAQATSLEESISRAVGLNVDRGDQVFVDSMEFAADMEPLAPQPPQPEPYIPWWVYVILAGLTVLLAATALILRRRRAAESTGETIDYAVGDAEPAEEPLSQEEEERQALRQQVNSLAQDKPEDFAQVVKTWLTDE